MKKLKTLLGTALILATCLSLFGCGSNTVDTDTKTALKTENTQIVICQIC